MGNLFSYYGFFYLIQLLYWAMRKKTPEDEDNEVVVIDAIDPIANIKKHYKPDMIFSVLNLVWIIYGCFTPEKFVFLSLTVITIAHVFIQGYLGVKNGEYSETSIKGVRFLKIILVFSMLVKHFF